MSIFLTSSAFSQIDSSNTTVYRYQDNILLHPDGTVGKLSFNIMASYISLKNQPGEPITDAQSFKAGMGFVLSEKLSEHHSFAMYREFNSTYTFTIGLSYYLANPTQDSISVNPDGKIGAPVLQVNAIHLMDNFKNTKSKTNFKSEIVIPLAHTFSIFGGYTKYDQISPRDIEELYGGLHIYFSSYPQSSAYENPDSPLSSFAISLSGGKSDYGKFGKLELLLPSSQSTTIKISATASTFEAPYDKSYTGSMQLFYYTGK